MPQLTFRGVPADKLLTVSEALATELAAICECGTDNFTMDVLQTTSVYGGSSSDTSYPFVEIGWFERGQAVRDQVAAAVTARLQEIGIADSEIAFRVYREDSYYINGVPCS
ncbi:DUF1904 family protein [Paenibacillus gorillae]|uniref:DUF1904 family protein n=1 Tax=Paenibacillus gorillae TaxID=1243662 RepID=UPI0004B13F08|nr:DUF1904 family protein [Paenibacillus gorillae]